MKRRNGNKRILAMLLALLMCFGLLPMSALAAPPDVSSALAEETTNTPATATLAQAGTIPTLTPADGITPNTAKRGDEWTGTWENGVYETVKMFRVNTQDSSSFATSSVIYNSEENAIGGAQNFAKEQSDYVQFLTGEGHKWDLAVVENEAQMTETYPEFYKSAFDVDANLSKDSDPADNRYGTWTKDVELPCSWTRQGYDYSIYTNTSVAFQGSEHSISSPLAPTEYNPVGL